MRGNVRGFTLIELLIVIAILVILAMTVTVTLVGFDYDARFASTKSNLSGIRSAISLFRSRHSGFPRPAVSGGDISTYHGENTLAAILTNMAGHGDGTEYMGQTFGKELISSSKGNDYVCIVKSIEDYYSDQSDGDNCINSSSEENFNAGGYVYCPVSGAIRLNFPVNGTDLRSEEQLPIDAFSDDWVVWGERNPQKRVDWIVRW
jgi:prepilin-type N-terminal cleavage/methylation domain-containing protein